MKQRRAPVVLRRPARELSVSPAAISQLIRALEDQVGRKLFHRINRGIAPTEAGLEILPRLSAAFDELKGVSCQLSGVGSPSRVTISVPPSVAMGWLSTRIAGFMAAHGPIDISLRGEVDPVDFDRDLIDIRMSYGRFHYRAHETEEDCDRRRLSRLLTRASSQAWTIRYG